MLLVPESHDARARRRSAPTGCRARSPASCTAPSSSPAPATTTACGRRTRCRRSSTGSTRRAGPSARRWSRARARTRASSATARSRTRSSGSSLELEDAEWQERSGYNRDAIAEAERDGDRRDRRSADRSSAGSSTSSAGRSTGAATRPDSSPARRWRRMSADPPPDTVTPHPYPPEDPRTMADPLDKQLVEAVLASRPRRSRRELEEAKLAAMRPRKATARPRPDAEDADDEDARRGRHRPRADEDAEPERRGAVSVEVVSRGGGRGGRHRVVPPGMDAPAKLYARRGRRADGRGARGRCPRT